ncbi:hypothetical protein Sa4125_43380 [Aureimonas sp. SA4125]|uniref:radical SAM protein n=1 Tax=Aureimonas sp. SA4125 TaxID=2826993 RepID=UPI001CC43AD6|nr:radical SAM protein [Aureimonas sp. SA4125]BDA86796.1 hypothetical protein Sa4125_43380 [Aureimonas sp. SA4125]
MASVLDHERARGLAADRLDLILMPTEKCNFRCVYCYEDFVLGRMAEATITGITRLLAQRLPKLRSLNIGWFGGEPTLALDIVERVNDFILAHRPPGLAFTSAMSTNGFRLDGRTLRRLVDREIRLFQISLDGDRQEHDATRRRKGGGGSFDVILGHVEAALRTDLDFRLALRLHARASNLESLARLIDRLAALSPPSGRISLYIKAIERLGGPADGGLDFIDNKAVLAPLEDRIRQAGLEEERARPIACYAALPNSLVVRADGRIAKCTVAFDDPRNTVGTLREDGTLAIDHERFRPWVRGILSGEAASMGCPLYGLPGPKTAEAGTAASAATSAL